MLSNPSTHAMPPGMRGNTGIGPQPWVEVDAAVALPGRGRSTTAPRPRRVPRVDPIVRRAPALRARSHAAKRRPDMTAPARTLPDFATLRSAHRRRPRCAAPRPGSEHPVEELRIHPRRGARRVAVERTSRLQARRPAQVIGAGSARPVSLTPTSGRSSSPGRHRRPPAGLEAGPPAADATEALLRPRGVT
jgi:hypothetical protein